MIVHHEDAPSPPACWNREPGPASYTRYGIDQFSGERIEVEVRMDWAKPGCQSWAPGIGHPTSDYPSGTPYPEAHGWKPWCLQCRHAPAEVVL